MAQVVASTRPAPAPPPRPAAPPWRRALVPAALFLAAALISGFTMLQGVDPFDEGLVLQAARRVASGQAPYRDFLWAYGPAQPYLLGALFKLLGVSLLDWRVLRVLADAGVSLLAFALVRRRAGLAAALVAWLAVACEMAEPRSANPFPFALLLALAAIALAASGARRRLLWAALMTVLAAAFRLDFALYALAATAVTLGLREPGVRAAARTALAYAAATVAGTALVYLPFAIVDGPARLYDAVIGTSLREGSYWTLPFPLVYHAHGAGALETVKHALDFYIPLLLCVGLAVTAIGLAARARRAGPAWPLAAGMTAFGLGALAYLLSRTDDFHAAPLLVVLAVVLPIVGVDALRRRAPPGLALAAACALLLAALVIHGAANRLSALTRPPAMSPIHLALADGVEAPPREARAIERMVALVDRLVPPGQPIYVAPRRSDLVRFNDPLAYVLTQRPNPTKRDFGLLTGAAAQRDIVTVLARVRPRAIVRWTDPISSTREPNLRGRPSGVHTLDVWIAARYRLIARLYHYDVLAPR